jgi:2'-5' RNA ligase
VGSGRGAFFPDLGGIAERFHPFDLKVQGINTFGSKGEDRVLFLSIPFSEELARVKKVCNWPSLERGPGNIPVKPFHPHITLARIKHPQKFAIQKKKILKALGDIEFTMHVDRLRLYSEIQGKKQTPIHDYLLRGH